MPRVTESAFFSKKACNRSSCPSFHNPADFPVQAASLPPSLPEIFTDADTNDSIRAAAGAGSETEECAENGLKLSAVTGHLVLFDLFEMLFAVGTEHKSLFSELYVRRRILRPEKEVRTGGF